jgi:hypothetical protein
MRFAAQVKVQAKAQAWLHNPSLHTAYCPLPIPLFRSSNSLLLLQPSLKAFGFVPFGNLFLPFGTLWYLIEIIMKMN